MAQKLYIDIDANGDRAKKGFQEVDGQIDKLDKTVKASGASLRQYQAEMEKIGGLFDQFMKRSMQAAGLAFAGIAYKAAEFSNAMREVNTTLGNTPGEIQKLTAGVLNMRDGFGNAAENARALYDALGSGLNPDESLSAVSEALVYAKANIVDMKDAIDIGVVSLNTYGAEIGSFPELYDDFTTATILAKMRGQEFAASFGEVAAGAHLAGISIKELLSYYISVTRGGLNAAEATVSLNNAIMQVATPSKDAIARAKQLGIEYSLAALKAKGFTQFFKEIAEKAGNSNQAIIDLFGSIRAFRGIAILTGETGMKNFNLGLKELADNADASQEALKKLADGNIQFQATELYQGLINAAIKESLPMLEDMARYIAANREEIVTAFKGILSLATAVGKAIAALVVVFVALQGPIQVIGAAMISMWVAGKVIAFYNSMKLVVAGTIEYVKVLQLAKVEQQALAVEYNNVSNDIVKSSKFMSMSVSSNFKAIGPIAASVAIAAAMAFRQMMQLIIDGLDAEMAKIIDKTNQSKTLTDNFRIILAQGTEAEKARVRQVIDEERKIRQAAEAGGAAVLENYRNQAKTYSQIYYERNKKEIDGILTRIAAEKNAADQIIVKQKEATEAQNQELDKRKESYDKFLSSIGMLYGENESKAAKLLENITQAWEKSSGAIIVNAGITEKFTAEVDKLIESFTTAGENVPASLQSIKQSLDSVSGEIEVMSETQADAIIMNTDYDASMARAAVTQKSFLLNVSLSSEYLKEMEGEIESSRQTAEDYVDSLSEIVGILADLGLFSEKAAKALGGLFSSINSVFSVVDKGNAMWAAFNKINLELETTKRNTPEATEKIRELTDLAEKAKPKFFDQLVNTIGQVVAWVGVLSSAYDLIQEIWGFDWGKSARTALSGLSGVTEEMSSGLARLAEELGDINRALVQMYAQLLKNANLINETQFAEWGGKFTGIIDDYLAAIYKAQAAIEALRNSGGEGRGGGNTDGRGRGGVDGKQKEDPYKALQKDLASLNDGFAALIDEAKRLGTEGSKSMIDILNAARDLEKQGYRIQAVWDYVTEKITGAASGLELYLSSFGDTLEIQQEMNKVMAGYDEQIRNKQKEIDRVQKELAENKTDIEKSIAASGFQKEIDAKQAEIDALEKQYDNAKSKNQKNAISSQIEAREKELAAIEAQLKKTGMQGTAEERAALEEKRLALQEEMNTYKGEMSILITESGNMLTFYTNKLNATRQDIVDNWDFIQGSVMATFNAFRAQGIPLLEIVTGRMKSQFDKIATLAKANGLEVSEGLKRLLNISDFGKNFKSLADQISGVTQMLIGLGDAGMMTQDDLSLFSGKITSQFDQIIAKTGNTQLAYDLLGPSLQKLAQYAESYGLKLDPATQALINQAKAAGAFAAVAKTDAEIMAGGFASVTDAVFLLVETLGGQVPEAMRKAVEEMKKGAGAVTTEAENAAADVNDKINVNAVAGSQGAADSITVAAGSIQASFVNVNIEIEKTWAYMSTQVVTAAEAMKAGTMSATDAMTAGFINAKMQVDSLIASMRVAFSMTAGALPVNPTVIPGFAQGTNGYIPAQTSIVGETGPELLQLSDTGNMKVTPLASDKPKKKDRPLVGVTNTAVTRTLTLNHDITLKGEATSEMNEKLIRYIIAAINEDRGGIQRVIKRLMV